MAYQQHKLFYDTITNMMIIAYYFLLCPGKYVLSNLEHTVPFQFQDIHLFCGPWKLDTHQATDQGLWSATFIGLKLEKCSQRQNYQPWQVQL